jgi:DNA-binding transcriptional LysR family regulator
VDKLRAIEVFVAISKSGSLTAAANQLGKSLPSVVRTLAMLEKEIGYRLFNRSTRKVALTEEGKAYLNHCTHMIGDLSIIEERLRNDKAILEGHVHITSPIAFGEKYIMPAITHFYQQHHSNLNIRLSSDDKVIDLVDQNIDIAVRIGHLSDSSLIARRVGDVRRVLCASPECIKTYGKVKKPADLRDKPCLQFTGKGAGTQWNFQKANEEIKIVIEGKMIGNMVNTLIQGCVAGLGYGIFLEYQVIDEIQSGGLEVLLPDYEPPVIPIHLIYPHAKLLPLRVKIVLDEFSTFIAQQLQKNSLKKPLK